MGSAPSRCGGKVRSSLRLICCSRAARCGPPIATTGRLAPPPPARRRRTASSSSASSCRPLGSATARSPSTLSNSAAAPSAARTCATDSVPPTTVPRRGLALDQGVGALRGGIADGGRGQQQGFGPRGRRRLPGLAQAVEQALGQVVRRGQRLGADHLAAAHHADVGEVPPLSMLISSFRAAPAWAAPAACRRRGRDRMRCSCAVSLSRSKRTPSLRREGGARGRWQAVRLVRQAAGAAAGAARPLRDRGGRGGRSWLSPVAYRCACSVGSGRPARSHPSR